jgi:hypothetical protein
MKRAFMAASSLALALAHACESGELDSFTSAGGAAGRGGTSNGGVSGVSGGTSAAGGEGGAASDSLLIDDFEDGDRFAALNRGEWFVSNDSTGNQTLSIAGPSLAWEDSKYALRTSGVGFQRFAAVVCDISGSAPTFDASAYAAITFVARAEPGSTKSLHFSFFSGNVNYAVPLTFGTDWGRHTIRFTDALPVEDANAVLDPRAIAAIQFNVPAGTSFDFWLDDLAFVR